MFFSSWVVPSHVLSFSTPFGKDKNFPNLWKGRRNLQLGLVFAFWGHWIVISSAGDD